MPAQAVALGPFEILKDLKKIISCINAIVDQDTSMAEKAEHVVHIAEVIVSYTATDLDDKAVDVIAKFASKPEVWEIVAKIVALFHQEQDDRDGIDFKEGFDGVNGIPWQFIAQVIAFIAFILEEVIKELK